MLFRIFRRNRRARGSFRFEGVVSQRFFAPPARTSPRKDELMVEIHLEESDRLDWALKAFKRKIAKAGILKDLRKTRYYVKPSEARQLKAAAARRRSRTERSR
jgi:small subunit ribosomal protein S21